MIHNSKNISLLGTHGTCVTHAKSIEKTGFTRVGVVMLTEQIKSLIENEYALSPRLTGVFFRKHLNQSMYGDDGQLTEFAIQCHHYFNELKRAAEQKAFHARLEQCRLQHEQQQES
ncbi:hypothetical protein, partial [Vibrio parahaemolyticus]|uniref:hypothetical protein n=1 Tax=Vibrio parahaemolyticus TaxID=670 RepID=UPI0011213CF9